MKKLHIKVTFHLSWYFNFIENLNFYSDIHSSRSPFGGLMIRKLFFISTTGTISLTKGIRTFF